MQKPVFPHRLFCILGQPLRPATSREPLATRYYRPHAGGKQ